MVRNLTMIISHSTSLLVTDRAGQDNVLKNEVMRLIVTVHVTGLPNNIDKIRLNVLLKYLDVHSGGG